MLQEYKTDSESLITNFLETGDTDKALELLFNLAISSAERLAFSEAETYRDRLLEIDSMALSKVIEVNEAMEAAKSKAFSPKFRQLWAPFFKGLSAEEAGAFFFALDEQMFQSETVVLTQGEPNDRLYLVRRGRLKVIYSDQDKEFLICTLGPGDFFGQDTLFSPNVCTASVKTLTEAHLGYMDKVTLDTLMEGPTALVENLKKVCDAGISITDRIKRKGMDRRSFKRIKLNTQVSFQLLPSQDRPTSMRSIKAELWDISKGGLSFYFGSKNRESTSLLIGRNIIVRIPLRTTEKSGVIAVTGVVHGVGSHLLDEYSVHVKLDRNFSDAALKRLQEIAKQR